MTQEKYIAIVRVRGMIGLNPDIKLTLEMLNLHNKNWCSFVKDNDANRGMVKKAKDYITYGEVTEEVMKELIDKRAEPSEEGFTYNKKTYKRFIRLSPPKKGYGRKGIKIPFNKGGALGNRGEKINDLLTRMM
jgi:large subunit ribosomal protein L30